ncbi:MAG: ferritin-like domain-containing protein, partial [Alphaproteobacteria bacterium]
MNEPKPTENAGLQNPYPIVAEVEFPEVWELCRQARELAWDPAGDIDWESLRNADIDPEARAAGAEFWSLRAWMEHGAVPYGCLRLREAVYDHLPFEIKQHITNFIAEELRHHEASFLIARNLAAYQPTPEADYFRFIIPKFHDEKVEKSMPFYAGMCLNTLFEHLSGALQKSRFDNARFPAIREVNRLILRDEARHIQFGRIIMRRLFHEISDEDKREMGEKFANKLRGSLLNGVYAIVNLPDEDRERAGKSRALAADAGLGATHPDEEIAIIAKALGE